MAWLVCVGGDADGRWQDVPDDAKIWNVRHRLEAFDFSKLSHPAHAQSLQSYTVQRYAVMTVREGKDSGFYRFLVLEGMSCCQALARVFNKY